MVWVILIGVQFAELKLKQPN